MTRKCGQTFAETLRVVGSGNVQVLERKANIAALLAGSYPEYRDLLRELETKALNQVFRILIGMPNGRALSRNTDSWSGLGSAVVNPPCRSSGTQSLSERTRSRRQMKEERESCSTCANRLDRRKT
jgi:hypothetical protein